jgi:hypothetical protein
MIPVDKGDRKALKDDPGTYHTDSAAESLGDKLEGIIRDLPDDRVTLAEILDLLGQEGLLILAAFLTLVFLIPVSIPGVSTVFGAAILLIGFCRLFNRGLWVPERIRKRQLPSETLRPGLRKGLIWFRRLERVSRPHRLRWVTRGRVMPALSDCAIILGAVLLMAPFGLIPFSNTLPAVAILLLAIGLLERDGACIILGHLTNLATIFYFALLIGGGGFTLYKLFRYF